jgi:hypothetical protein
MVENRRRIFYSAVWRGGLRFIAPEQKEQS